MDREFLEQLSLSPETVDTILAAHQQSLQQLQLTYQTEAVITAAGGRNIKAITALLDLQAVAEAADARTALEQAVAAVKQDNEYLFEQPQPPKYARTTGQSGSGAFTEPTTLAGALRARMGR